MLRSYINIVSLTLLGFIISNGLHRNLDVVKENQRIKEKEAERQRKANKGPSLIERLLAMRRGQTK